MKAMILAAGLGSRMGELTSECPKVILPVAGRTLIDFHLANLTNAGVTDVVVNLHYQPEKIKHYLANNNPYGLTVHYSEEEELLGMAGGVYNALPLLGDEPFIVVSGDMWTDYNYAELIDKTTHLAHLVMVDNPPFHPQGDFELHDGFIAYGNENTLNFAGCGIYHPEFFANVGKGCYGITKPLSSAIPQQQVTGEYYAGQWANVNTPEELQQLEQHLQQDRKQI